MSPLYFTALPVLCALLVQPLIGQASAFLREHQGPPLHRTQRRAVTVLFSVLVCVLLFYRTANALTPDDTLKITLLLAWGVPLTLLDLRCHWLPLRFTHGFWLSGLLLTALPDSRVAFSAALLSSAGMFTALWLFRWTVNRLAGEERLGLGDVHLIAGLAAWFGWPLACLLSAGAFGLLFLAGCGCRQRALPYAPWLFALLAGLAGGFPQLLSGNVYDFLFSLPH